jgi:hypothetical protein
VVTARHRSWLVAVDATGALSRADFSRFRDRSGDRFTAEEGVYARENVRAQGAGKERMAQQVGGRDPAKLPPDDHRDRRSGEGRLSRRACQRWLPAGRIITAARLKFVQWLDVVYVQPPSRIHPRGRRRVTRPPHLIVR